MSFLRSLLAVARAMLAARRIQRYADGWKRIADELRQSRER